MGSMGVFHVCIAHEMTDHLFCNIFVVLRCGIKDASNPLFQNVFLTMYSTNASYVIVFGLVLFEVKECFGCFWLILFKRCVVPDP